MHYLEPLFVPRSIAVVGASQRSGSLGNIVLENLRTGGFGGEIVAVNPKHSEVAGIRCYASLAAIGHPVDLAVVATPSETVPAILLDAGHAGVRHMVVLSAGFGETGPLGKALEEKVATITRAQGVRMIGPNCLGIMRPSIGLNATFGRNAARAGGVALVSQSGALVTALVDAAAAMGIGFSSVISTGAGTDLDFGEILDFLACDPETRTILLYIEGVHNARGFISGLRAAARIKPIVVLKVGRHLSGSRAAMSHTGALAGNDAVFDAVFRRCGVIRVRTYEEMLAAASLMGTVQLPQGNRLIVLTNGGGPGVLAADYAADAGIELAQLSPSTLATLNNVLPKQWSHGNPVDILGDADITRLKAGLAAVLADEGNDAVLALFYPQLLLPARLAAQTIIESAQSSHKPILTAWLGGVDMQPGCELVEASNLPAFHSPESAVAAFGMLAAYRRAQHLLQEVPSPQTQTNTYDLDTAKAIGAAAVAAGRTMLTEPESKRLLTCFGIAVPATIVATSAAEVRTAAQQLGYPLAMKILSRDISHKSDVKGVRLGIRDESSLLREYELLLSQVHAAKPDAHIDGVVVQPMIEKRFGRELMIGIATDAVFGRFLSFGAGGIAVELLRDNMIGLPPLNRVLAQDMVSRTRISRVLGAYRQVPAADESAIIDVLLRVSDMACALPWLAEMDINPLLADNTGCVALDARVVIDSARMQPNDRYNHIAIHPYPVQFEEQVKLADGAMMQVRPIRPEDAAMEREFVEHHMSGLSRYMRFFNAVHTLTPELLVRLTQIDYDRELALIAIPANAENMVGIARYAPHPDGVSCEFTIAVDDAWRNRGVATLLMTRLMGAARATGYQYMTGSVLPDNEHVLHLVHRLGFEASRSKVDGNLIEITRRLD